MGSCKEQGQGEEESSLHDHRQYAHQRRYLIPGNAFIILTDISDGIVRETGKKLAELNHDIQCQVMDAHHIYAEDGSFDVVIANHMLFYCESIDQVIMECRRVLKKGGKLICSTYSRLHMKEITELVQEFNQEIMLSSDVLYERFGLDNGNDILNRYFESVQCIRYEDSIEINTSEPLINYIVSCHGNQNRILIDRYREFRDFVADKVKDGFHITKDAGIFIGIV